MKTSSQPSKSSQPWWQWVLMYPTLAVAIVGAVPQYQQWLWAVVRGLPPGSDVSELQAQDSAWQQNVDCLTRIQHVTPPSETPYAIDLLTCPSGDILLTVRPLNATAQAVSRWIITNKLFQTAATSGLISSAYAQAPTPAPSVAQPISVLDVRKVGSQVVRRVQLSNGTCVDQMIDSYTGRHLADKPAPCTKFASR